MPAADAPAPGAFAIAGIAVIWAGLVARVWAVVTLGGSFATFVEVHADQAVVDRGPYRWIRHPSYTGLLLIALGFGLAAANWLSLVVCAVVPLLGLLPRIAVEEGPDAPRPRRSTCATLWFERGRLAFTAIRLTSPIGGLTLLPSCGPHWPA